MTTNRIKIKYYVSVLITLILGVYLLIKKKEFIHQFILNTFRILQNQSGG
jgi:hypothetical protein